MASDSLSIPEQLSRWQEHISMWESALNSGLEVVSLGDYNINHCNWMEKNISRSNQTYKLRSLIDELFVRILPLGVSQLVTGPTRHFPGQKSTGLDHIYTNTPEKIINVQKFFCGGSDHMLIYAVRSSKCIRSCPTYVRKRCYKNFNPDLFINSVRNMGWLDLYMTEDLNHATQLFKWKLRGILDVMAPMKIIQVRRDYNCWLSQDTKNMMKLRDSLQKRASETNDKMHWNAFKKIRNKINNRQKYEERVWQKQKISECGNDTKKTWKNIKSILNWHSSGSPAKLFWKGEMKNNP